MGTEDLMWMCRKHYQLPVGSLIHKNNCVVCENERLKAALKRITGVEGHDYELVQEIAQEALNGCS